MALAMMDMLSDSLVIMTINEQTGLVIQYEVFKRALCFHMSISHQIGTVHCPEPCNEYAYEVTTAGSPWPHRSDQLAFYNSFIAPHPVNLRKQVRRLRRDPCGRRKYQRRGDPETHRRRKTY